MKIKYVLITLAIALIAFSCASEPESSQNNSDKLSALEATLAAEQAAEMEDDVPNFKAQDFESEMTPTVVFKAYKGAKWEPVTEGTMDGSTGMMYKASFLDADYSGVKITPAPELGKTWNWGAGCTFSFDAANPNTQKIQIRLNVFDIRNTLRTYYFNLEPGEARTISITPEKLGKSDDDWSLPDGFWGGNGGLVTEKIKTMELYIWEDNDFGSSATTVIFDNMKVEL